MKRREAEIFNLSFLDVLSGALGAVLFLFIVVPKDTGKGPDAQPILNITYDTIFNKFYGDIPDSLQLARAGDSLLALVVDYDVMPTIKNCPPPKPCPKCPDVSGLQNRVKQLEGALKAQEKKIPPMAKNTGNPTSRPASAYKGDLPSVPCKFSVEVKWDDIEDNIDLYLCKEGSCVYGGRRKNNNIGYWDSGKSKTSFFGGDLRTTQEAVRQFDSVKEGEYEIYVQYKDSEVPKPDIQIAGLVYTHTEERGEQGETFNLNLTLDKSNRTLVGRVNLKADGSFTFIKN